jgi:hypothetical protein
MAESRGEIMITGIEVGAERARATAAETANANSINAMTRNNAGNRNSIFYGDYLGTAVTDAQWSEISAGTFGGLHLGDYWMIGGVNWRIAGFDIYLNTGDTALTKHALTIVPDTNLYNAQMNTTNTTTGGYYNSAMKQTNLATALTTIKNNFGDAHIITRRALLDNAVSGNDSSGWSWYDSQIDLLTEEQVYGVPAWGATTHSGYHIGTDYSRLPLFALAPQYICNRSWWWLRSVYSSSNFCNVNSNGSANFNSASTLAVCVPLS